MDFLLEATFGGLKWQTTSLVSWILYPRMTTKEILVSITRAGQLMLCASNHCGINNIFAPRREAPRRLLFSNRALRRTSVRQMSLPFFLEITRVVSAPASFHHYTVLSRGLIFGFQNQSRNNRISAERSDRLGPCFGPLLENFFGIFENTD